ncbi:MAG: AarF/ABC1/UbiB kinase family protein [Deltaproteobacteria bacterium]|nr:AarF/ABC1/UbiB kinase family protein [Deltaproteobacteria bacterium]
MKKLLQPIQVAVRSQRIAWIAYSYGLGGALAALGIEVGKRGLTFARIWRTPVFPLDGVLGRNLAKTFSKLGPTFIKLGQLMASRPDLVGEAVSEELKVLFDRVPAMSYSHVRKILVSELGKEKIKRLIKEIQKEPLASASIGQTHRATLRDGTPIILKVQRVGVAELVALDLTILEGIVRSLSKWSTRFDLNQIFLDFKEATLREIDYREEAKNIERFHKNYWKLFSDPAVVFPHCFSELTTEKVIALEPLHGKKIAALQKGSTVARKAAHMTVSAILEQIFDHGFFHADPHAGNLFFLEEGRIGLIDLGLVGQLDPKDKRKFLRVLLAVLEQDRDRLSRALFELGIPSVKTSFKKFDKDIQDLLDQLKKEGLQNIRMDKLVTSLFSVARQNGIAIPQRYILMLRSCLIIEGVAKSLDPQISIAKIAAPIVAKSLIKSYNPFRFFRQ